MERSGTTGTAGPMGDHLQALSRDVEVARSVYSTWADNRAHFTDIPKRTLENALKQWHRFQQLYPHSTQSLTPLFEELAACRELIGDAPYMGDERKRTVIPSVIDCLNRLHTEINRPLGA
jgi:hypothetical protein